MNDEKKDQPIAEPIRQPEHKPLTLAQNVVMTIKVLLGAAIVIGAIVALDKLAG